MMKAASSSDEIARNCSSRSLRPESLEIRAHAVTRDACADPRDAVRSDAPGTPQGYPRGQTPTANRILMKKKKKWGVGGSNEKVKKFFLGGGGGRNAV